MTDPPPPEEITDPAMLKALTHPLRQKILQQLSVLGDATATSLAEKLGENTGATSYHLRQLARHGFVEEVPERAHGRERWWRARSRDLRFPRRSEQSPELRTVLEEMEAVKFTEDMAAFARFQAERGGMGDWGDALPYSRGMLHVTPAELLEFFEEYIKLLKRYWRPADARPEGSRAVYTRFIAFPVVGPAPQDDESAQAGEGGTA